MDNFQKALGALNAGNLGEAERLFGAVLRQQPDHVPALNLLTVVLMSGERFAEAEKFISKAVSLNKGSDVSFYNYGLISKKLNKPQQAIEQFDKALALSRNVPETWNNRGTALNDLKEYEAALSDFDRAIALNANYGEAYANKAKSLTELRRYGDACTAYDKALSLKPDLAEAWLGRGKAFSGLKRYDQALASYERALLLQPGLAEAWLARGNILTDLRRYDAAFDAYDKALSADPDLAPAWLGRGNAFTALKRYDEALAAYDKALSINAGLADAWRWRGVVKLVNGNVTGGQSDCQQAIALGADRDIVQFDLARYGATKTPGSPPPQIVEELFDNYASYFDAHLAALKYDVPAKLTDLILRHTTRKQLDILDLGCGTGLLGAKLKPLANTLIGVDLSRQMLDKAKERAIYDELVCDDIVKFTCADERRYDLVTSTDVFIYVGDLSAIFTAVASRLNDNGLFAFSVESTDGDGYELKDTGRYQHSRDYLERLARDAGLKTDVLAVDTIREEGPRQLPGLLVIMSRR